MFWKKGSRKESKTSLSSKKEGRSEAEDLAEEAENAHFLIYLQNWRALLNGKKNESEVWTSLFSVDSSIPGVQGKMCLYVQSF